MSGILRKKNRYRTIEGGDAANLLPFYLARTGILSEPQAGTVRFTHNSFQEYLTAFYLNVRHQEGAANSFEFLLTRVESEFWRESAHLYLSLRQKDSQNLAYRTILRKLDLNEAGQQLFLAEILGSEEIAFSEEERKRWIELLLLSAMGGIGEPSLWGALLKRKNNLKTAHTLCDDWLKKRPALVRDEFKKQWKKINRLSFLGLDWGNRDDPLEDSKASSG